MHLLEELDISCDIIYEMVELQEMLELYEEILLNESVQTLADKFQMWLERKNISPQDLGCLVAGLSILLSSEGRSAITRDDLINMGLHGDLRRAEKIDNVDLNSMIRNQIIHLGKTRAPKLSSMVTEAINQQRYNQIRNFLLKLSVYVDRLKNKEKYVKQEPHVMKSSRRNNPSVQSVPTHK